MSQEIKTPKKKIPFKMPLRVYLGYLLMLTLVFTAVSFSKFATSGDSNDAATVASFTVSAVVSDDDTKTIGFNDAASKFGTSNTAVYEIDVTNAENGNASEVAVGYDIIVSYDSSVISPDALTLSIDGTELSYVSKGGRYIYTYSKASPMPAATVTERTHTLSVTAASDKIVDDYSDIQLSVFVLFEQID